MLGSVVCSGAVLEPEEDARADPVDHEFTCTGSQLASENVPDEPETVLIKLNVGVTVEKTIEVGAVAEATTRVTAQLLVAQPKFVTGFRSPAEE